LFVPNNFLCREPESFCLYDTAAANNDIKHCDAFFFARNPVGITHNQLVAVLTNGIHIFLTGKERAITLIYMDGRNVRLMDNKANLCLTNQK
jgi:hypothetical protein